jgi:hypothetical protein
MWTSEIVRIRFVEAAGTERFLSALRLPTANGYWPQFQYDKEDEAGWDQAAKDDHLSIWQGRGTAKADALSRYQECLSWTIERVTSPDRRRLIWGFAFCRAYKREFGKWCDKRGMAKSTAYNRLNRTWDHLSFNLNNDRVLLREAAQFWIGHETPLVASICATDDFRPPAKLGVPYKPSFRTEPSRDLLKTPEDVIQFSKHLARTNSDRAREQKRRELCERGVA